MHDETLQVSQVNVLSIAQPSQLDEYAYSFLLSCDMVIAEYT